MDDDFISRRRLLEKTMLPAAGLGLAAASVPSAAMAGQAIEPVTLGPGEKLRVGILGCGNRSRAHISSLNTIDHIEIAALCDIIPEKMEEKSQLIKAGKPRRFTDYHEMLAQGDLQAVGIALPNTLHREAIIACLQAGKHVLCEKPLTMTVRDCQDVIKAFDRYKRVVQVGTQRRHSAGYQALTAKLRQGLIGQILYGWVNTFRADWIKLYPDPAEDSAKNWRMKQAMGGAVIYEMGIHLLDLFNWLIDSPPVEVTSMGGVHNKKLEKRDSWNHAGIIARYENGALMTYGGHLYSCVGSPPDFLFGDEATLEVPGEAATRAKVTKAPYWRPYAERGERPSTQRIEVELPPSGNTTTAEWNYFYESVQGKKPAFPSPRHHLPALQIAEGALKSAAAHRHIKVSELG
jgi:predicted dehydrogenase